MQTLDRVSQDTGFYGALIQEKGEMANEGVTISIVDDDESVRKAIKRLIESVGLNVAVFASAEDFLSSGRSQDSACLILDVRLTGMSGIELHTHLVASDCRLPIIFISAHGDGQERMRALDAGAIDFLQKPFSEQALFNAIDSSLALQYGKDSNSTDKNQSI
jgi:FixJ family two-component response regulator